MNIFKNLFSKKIKETPTRLSAQIIQLYGRDFYIDPLDSLGLKESSVFEPDETNLSKKLISEGDVCLDIGANIGYYTVLFSQLATQSGKIIAIEPDPENFGLLQMNCEQEVKKGIVSLYNVALGEQKSEAALFKSKDNHGMHRLYSSVCCTEEFTNVSVVRGDDIVDEKIDFLKIDIEGYEYAALKGLQKTIESSQTIKILSEFSPLSIKEAGFSPKKLIDFLTDMNLIPLELFENSWKLLDVNELLEAVEKIEDIDIDGLKASMKDQTNQEITEAAVHALLNANYPRPLLENLLWVKEKNCERVVNMLDYSTI